MDLLKPYGGRPPDGSRALLKEYGRIVQALDTLNREHDEARARRRLTAARRLRREVKGLRFLLLKLGDQVRELAGSKRSEDRPSPLLVDVTDEDERYG